MKQQNAKSTVHLSILRMSTHLDRHASMNCVNNSAKSLSSYSVEQQAAKSWIHEVKTLSLSAYLSVTLQNSQALNVALNLHLFPYPPPGKSSTAETHLHAHAGVRILFEPIEEL